MPMGERLASIPQKPSSRSCHCQHPSVTSISGGNFRAPTSPSSDKPRYDGKGKDET